MGKNKNTDGDGVGGHNNGCLLLIYPVVTDPEEPSGVNSVYYLVHTKTEAV